MKWIDKLFKEPEKGMVKLKFIALDDTGEPYEDVATVPYHVEYIQENVESKFIHFMELRKHKVLEITILEVNKTG